MTYVYDAEINIHSVIDNLDDNGLPEGEPEINIITVHGTYKTDGVCRELYYTEENEGGKTQCTLVVGDDGVITLTRCGAIESVMSFKEGASTDTVYKIPPYSFDMTISTARIRNSLREHGGELQLIYAMTVGGQSKKVRMKLSVRA